MRKNHDVKAMEDIARIMTINQTEQSQIEAVVNWMKTPAMMRELQQITDILEKGLGFKYFINLRHTLKPPDYEYFLNHLKVEHREYGNIVIDKGKKNDNFYIILQGQIVILDDLNSTMSFNTPNLDDQSEKILFQKINSLKPGDTFGQLSLINPKMLTNARVIAKTNVVLLVASQDTFYRTLCDGQHMKYTEKLHYFRQNILFEGVHQNKLRELLPEITQIRYNLNEEVYNKRALHQQIYFIVQGEVQLQNEKQKGFVILGAGEYFGVERLELDAAPRAQSAVSKSQQLMIYRILFKRLPILQGQLPKFMDNLTVNFEKKSHFYNNLFEKNRLVDRLLNKPTKNKNRVRTKQRRTTKVDNKLCLEWWGISRSNSNQKSIRARRIKYTSAVQKDNKTQIESISMVTNKGVTNIDALVRVSKQNSYRMKSVLKQCNSQQSLPIGYLASNYLRSHFSKRTLRQEQQLGNEDARILKRNLLPKINKAKLMKYAASNQNFCEKLHFD